MLFWGGGAIKPFKSAYFKHLLSLMLDFIISINKGFVLKIFWQRLQGFNKKKAKACEKKGLKWKMAVKQLGKINLYYFNADNASGVFNIDKISESSIYY